MDFPSIFNNGVRPVETQNLASPVPPTPTCTCDNPMTINAYPLSRDAKFCVSRPLHSNPASNYTLKNKCFFPCETQDFASLLFSSAHDNMDLPPIFNNGVSPVETQNFASPVLASSIDVACYCSPYLHSRSLPNNPLQYTHAIIQ